MQGIIRNITGLGGSILTILVELEDGTMGFIHAEARATIEALRDAFGSLDEAVDQRIEYQLTDYGVLSSFEVV